MRLKKLEIYGFKSFAERTSMTFDNGITGVVGPNGSGKSNIGDAVRWVLGEQSAKTLRGAKMEDVIFGGTEKRRALAYCEVSLVFDNADGRLPVEYSEVMITRRVYRSGESEYSLNKSACRLKDIVDLFRDTGIGKEGYSLIGQGRIDEILSVKSEERRAVFEEAAGITKFKARKQEAERRMENTAENLARVQDIVEEVGSKLPALQRQAETAKLYLKLSQEQKDLEVNAFLLQHERLNHNLEQLDAQASQLAREMEAFQAQEAEGKLNAQALEEELAALDAQMSALHAAVLESTRSAEISEGDAAVLRERIAAAQRDLQRLAAESERDKALAAQARGRLEQSKGAGDARGTRLDQLEQERQRLSAQREEAEREVARREETAERMKGEMIDSFNRLSDVKSSQARLTATRDALQERLAGLCQHSAGQTLEEAQKAQAEARQALGLAQQTLAGLREQSNKAQTERAACNRQAQEEGQALQRAMGALREAASRLKMLEAMRRDYEGYQNSVREALKYFSGQPSVFGVVAGLMRVPKELERAVEMALGGAMQNIVCAREEDAKAMIEYLRTNRLGRATFLPLSAVRARVLSAQERSVLKLPGCVGVASELVQFEERFRPVMENLLGRTVIAQDLQAGIAIMRQGRQAFRLVTLQGDVMHSGGSMTGGSLQSRTTSLLSRQREIDEHKAAQSRLQERVEQGKAQLAALERRAQEIQEQLAAAQEAVHQQDIAVTREQERLSRAQEAVREALERAGAQAREREQLEGSIREISQELASIAQRSGQAQALSSTTQRDIAQYNEQTRKARERLDGLREQAAALEDELAAGRQEREMLDRERTRLMEQLQELENAQAIRTRSAKALEERQERDSQALKQTQAQIQRLREVLGGHQTALEQAGRQRTQRQEKLRAVTQEMETLRARLEEANERQHRHQMAKTRMQAELKQLQDRIWEHYELTYALAEPLRRADFDWTSAKARLEEIRAQVRSMGTVNVNALQEYEETNGRFEELTRQRQDLLKAQDDLQAIIGELQRKMERQFVEQFQMLNRHFGATFTRLFGGGTARLRLQDESDVLQCGIDIVAQPPGKKLQLLSLLSGGERALTAIAILFAMLAIRPTPFCILDEIEAALDEANVVNFADYLAEYAQDTQFIVVTHRKGTMERCNTLYGVAMEEKGVSRMVSVCLSELEKKLEEETHE